MRPGLFPRVVLRSFSVPPKDILPEWHSGKARSTLCPRSLGFRGPRDPDSYTLIPEDQPSKIIAELGGLDLAGLEVRAAAFRHGETLAVSEVGYPTKSTCEADVTRRQRSWTRRPGASAARAFVRLPNSPEYA